jgi:hypothetical protein
MRFSHSLRGDLAKLSDTDLAARLEAAWRAYEVAKSKGEKLWWRLAPPIRHPWAYRLLSLVGVSGPGFSFFFGWSPLWFGVADMHLTLCEIEDIHDEIERRRPRQTAKGGEQ